MNDIFVQLSDRLIIVEKPNTIQIIGEVNTPGFYNYKNRMRVSNVINEAGGLTNNADLSNIFIRYPNGKSKNMVDGRTRKSLMAQLLSLV